MLVLWGMRSGQGSGYDVLKVWRDHADDVRGLGIDSGHFIPEEQPDGVYAALRSSSTSNPASPSGTRRHRAGVAGNAAGGSAIFGHSVGPGQVRQCH
jgi:hypothetical protein